MKLKGSYNADCTSTTTDISNNSVCVCISVTIFQENFTYIMYTAMLKFDLRFIVDIMDLKNKTKQNKTKQTK